MSEWCPELYGKHIDKVRFKFQSILEYFGSAGLYSDYCVSGGALCQIFHEKSWKSDLDLFYLIDYTSNTRRKLFGGIDFVGKNYIHIQNVVRQFDCSLVQVQYCKDDQLYFTPLFIISLITKCAYWTTRGTNFYCCDSGDQYDYDGEIDDIFSHMCRIHDGVNSIDCQENVLGSPNNFAEKSAIWVKWFTRIRKYKKRFPEFQFEMLNLKQEEEIQQQKKKLKK
jgi:hypothetical protein